MAQKICPRCQRVITYSEHAGNDYVHECDSGNATVDNEDVIRINVYNWNRQGLGNEASAKARLMGADVEDMTKRGNRKSTHRTRSHYEYIGGLE